MSVKSNESDATPAPPTGGVTTVNGAKVDLWDSNWPGGRYYWTVMPVNAVAATTITTTLATAAQPADTVITLADGTGIAAGDALKVGSPVAENAIVKSVAGNSITLMGGLSAFHNAGEDVVRTGGGITYRDAELAQDSCAAGHRLAFAKFSEPVVSGEIAPYASGLSPEGKLVGASTAKPRFYGQPLVAWQPVASADQYEVQWSTKRYPWKTAGSQLTWGT